MRPIRLLQTDQGLALTDAAAIFSGTQIDERTVIDTTGTVLDPDICRNGGWIDLPFPCEDYAGRQINQLWYPAFENQHEGRIITLNQMAIAANRLLRLIQSYVEGLIPDDFVKRGVLTYQYNAILRLGGKSGIVNSNIIAGRVKHSGRGVLVVNATYSPEIVSVHEDMLTNLKLEEGDLAIIGREPTVWGGSIEVVRVRKGRSHAIEVHPLLFKQMGGDCDGDTIYIYAVPKDPDCQAEAKQQILGFAKTFAKWPSYMRLNDPDDQVDWENVHEDSKKRGKITGFSVSPEEILSQGERLKQLCKTTGKDVAAECKAIAMGVSTDEYKKYVEDQNAALVTMKLGMGPIGAAANKLRLIAGVNQKLLESASYLSERLQQILLDTKHTIGNRDTYSINDILAMLNKKDPYGKMFLEDILVELEKVGIDSERVWPIMSYIWIVWPLTKAVRIVYDGMQESRLKRIETYVHDFIYGRNIQLVIRKVIVTGGCHRKVGVEELTKAFYEHSFGVNKICEIEYPMTMLINDRVMADRVAAMDIAKRLFSERQKDASGVTRLALEEAFGVHTR